MIINNSIEWISVFIETILKFPFVFGNFIIFFGSWYIAKKVIEAHLNKPAKILILLIICMTAVANIFNILYWLSGYLLLDIYIFSTSSQILRIVKAFQFMPSNSLWFLFSNLTIWILFPPIFLGYLIFQRSLSFLSKYLIGFSYLLMIASISAIGAITILEQVVFERQVCLGISCPPTYRLEIETKTLYKFEDAESPNISLLSSIDESLIYTLIPDWKKETPPSTSLWSGLYLTSPDFEGYDERTYQVKNGAIISIIKSLDGTKLENFGMGNQLNSEVFIGGKETYKSFYCGPDCGQLFVFINGNENYEIHFACGPNCSTIEEMKNHPSYSELVEFLNSLKLKEENIFKEGL